MTDNEMLKIFNQYENIFHVWLYSAWDFSRVDWEGLAKKAQSCIERNTPMSDEEKMAFFPKMKENVIY